MSRTLRWVAAALAGVALAVALTLATLRLTDQHVGLAGEPPSAGSGLVPTVAPDTTVTRTLTVTTPRPAPTPSDDGGTVGGDGEGDD